MTNKKNKEEVLQYIQLLAEEKVLTKKELIKAYDSGHETEHDVVLTKKAEMSDILYYIGGAIVFLGIVTMLFQNWSVINFATKILITLGSGIGAYVVGFIFNRNKKTAAMSSVFFLISALTTPIGFWLIFDQVGLDASSFGAQTLISGMMLTTFLLSYVIFRKNIFILFSILFGTWFFFAFTSYFIGGNPYSTDLKFHEYRLLVTSLSYMLIGHSFSKSVRAPLSDFLYGFGILGFLGTTLALGGWQPNQNIFWELIYPGLVFGALFISVKIKRKSFLIWGTIFLMAYILKITGEYFSNSLGWPLALVIGGLGLIGVGYMSFTLKNKYLST